MNSCILILYTLTLSANIARRNGLVETSGHMTAHADNLILDNLFPTQNDLHISQIKVYFPSISSKLKFYPLESVVISEPILI